jgi:hypothetical protein
MFIVEPQGSSPIVADSPEEAVRKHCEKEPEDVAYFNVYDTNTSEFFVIAHRGDLDPQVYDEMEERVVHFNKAARQKLIEEMMFKAHCDDKALRQLCEMAAMQINTDDGYKDWVQEDTDEAHT